MTTATRPATVNPLTVADARHTAAGLTAQFLRDGFLPGLPRGFPGEARDIDARIASRMKCPRCHGRCAYRPFHNGARYRVIAACRDKDCGGAEEM